MARTPIVPNTAVTSGVAPTQTAGLADGFEFLNTGRQVIRAYNADAGAHTITIVTGGQVNGGGGSEPIADRTVSIPATSAKYIGPFDTAIYNDPTNRLVDIDLESGEHDHFELEIITVT